MTINKLYLFVFLIVNEICPSLLQTCPTYEYLPTNNLSPCTGCLKLIPAGYYVSSCCSTYFNTAVYPCPPGTSGASAPIDAYSYCTNPSYANSLNPLCYPCLLGTYSNGSGLTSCIGCPAGTTSTGSGAQSCTGCGYGTYAPTQGSTIGGTCLFCWFGTYGPTKGLTSCLVCTAGTYMSTTSASACLKCQGACPPGVNGGCDPISGAVSCSGSCSATTLSSPGTWNTGAFLQCQPCTSQCAVGSNISQMCTLSSNSICSPCVAGTAYVNLPANYTSSLSAAYAVCIALCSTCIFY